MKKEPGTFWPPALLSVMSILQKAKVDIEQDGKEQEKDSRNQVSYTPNSGLLKTEEADPKRPGRACACGGWEILTGLAANRSAACVDSLRG